MVPIELAVGEAGWKVLVEVEAVARNAVEEQVVEAGGRRR